MKPQKLWAAIHPSGRIMEMRDTEESARNWAYNETFDKSLKIIPVTVTEGHNDGWIPMSERLPEKEGEYAIRLEYPKNPPQALTDEFYRGSFSKYWYGRITHWQPLPSAEVPE